MGSSGLQRLCGECVGKSRSHDNGHYWLNIRIGTNGRIYISDKLVDNSYFDNLSYYLEGSGFYVTYFHKGKGVGLGQNSTRGGSIYSSNTKLLKNGDIVIVGLYEGREEVSVDVSGDQKQLGCLQLHVVNNRRLFEKNHGALSVFKLEKRWM